MIPLIFEEEREKHIKQKEALEYFIALVKSSKASPFNFSCKKRFSPFYGCEYTFNLLSPPRLDNFVHLQAYHCGHIPCY